MPTSRAGTGPFPCPAAVPHQDEHESLALDFKSATLYAIRVVLHSADPERLSAALAKRMADAGSFFENEGRCQPRRGNHRLAGADRRAARHNLPPIGVVAEGANLEAAARRTPGTVHAGPASAQAVDMAPANDVSTPVPSIQAAAVTTAPAPSDAEPRPPARPRPRPTPCRNARPPHLGACPDRLRAALLVGAGHQAAALGQRVYARHTDLVVIGMVSQAPRSSPTAMACCAVRPWRARRCHGPPSPTHLDAELLAVAGVYRVVGTSSTARCTTNRRWSDWTATRCASRP